MNNVTGIVKKITSRQAGKGTAYNFVVAENGQETWYGHGFAPPKFAEGDTISFAWEASGNFKNVSAHSVKKVEGAAPAPAAAAAPAQGGGGYSPARPNNTQLAIQYQASRNSAIATLDVLLTHNAVPIPAKKADQYDAVLALVDDLTNVYHAKTDKVVADGGIVLDDVEVAAATAENF